MHSTSLRILSKQNQPSDRANRYTSQSSNKTGWNMCPWDGGINHFDGFQFHNNNKEKMALHEWL
jgi:hypothetical protein